MIGADWSEATGTADVLEPSYANFDVANLVSVDDLQHIGAFSVAGVSQIGYHGWCYVKAPCFEY